MHPSTRKRIVRIREDSEIEGHWHFDIITLAFTAIGVTLIQKIWYIVAAWLAQQGGAMGNFGVALGGIVTNPSK